MQSKGLSKSLLQHHSSKASILLYVPSNSVQKHQSFVIKWMLIIADCSDSVIVPWRLLNLVEVAVDILSGHNDSFKTCSQAILGNMQNCLCMRTSLTLFLKHDLSLIFTAYIKVFSEFSQVWLVKFKHFPNLYEHWEMSHLQHSGTFLPVLTGFWCLLLPKYSKETLAILL